MSLSVFIASSSAPGILSESVCPPLSASLANLGFEFVNQAKGSNFYIAFNHSKKNYRAFIKSGGSKSRTALIRLEPASVYPAQYRQRIEGLYSHIFTLGDTSDPEWNTYSWPYYFNQNPLKPSEWRSDLAENLKKHLNKQDYSFESWRRRGYPLSMVASNKVSAISKNNYQLRRMFALRIPNSVLYVFGSLWGPHIFEKLIHRLSVLSFAIRTGVAPNLIQIYGDLFQKYSTFQGRILDKHTVIRNSKFSLVIENDDNYVSEKLIDALVGGSIPIYTGGRFKTLGVPECLVVAGLRSVSEILEFMDAITDEEIEKRLMETAKWLHSEDFFRDWFGDNVFDRVASEIGAKFMKLVK